MVHEPFIADCRGVFWKRPNHRRRPAARCIFFLSLSRSLCNFTMDQQNFVFNLSRRTFLGRNPSIVLGSLIFIYSLGHRKRSALFCYTLYLQLVLNVYFEYKKSSSHAQDELLWNTHKKSADKLVLTANGYNYLDGGALILNSCLLIMTIFHYFVPYPPHVVFHKM